jgi:asparagine synthase (glutamine-hydrolysing)
MCGIVGWKSKRNIDKNKIVKMADSIAHRGPDGEGYYYASDNTLALAHKRLSIIDPEHGHQPMYSNAGEVVVTFNGAIYNFLELRRELISLGAPIKTYSDTEVLLYSYLEWGEKCIDRFNGMFAFVIHDKRKHILFGARDRLGEKPLYYFHNNENFIFASEIKAILASNEVKANLNNESLHEYLTFQYYLDNNTLFDNIVKLKPGHFFILNEKTMHLNVQEYWDISYDKEHEEQSEEYYVDKLRSLINDSIALRLRADVPLGSHLSGGIDSSAVASLNALRLGNNIKLETFTGKFAEGLDYDETKFALKVSKNINSNYNEIVIKDTDFLESIEDIVYYMDEPQAGPGVFSQYQVAKHASKKVKVVLGGQGGDEIFLGYTRYLIAYYEKMLKRNISESGQYYQNILNNMTPNLFQMNGYQPMMQDFFADGLFEDDARRYFRLTNRFSSNESIFSKDFLQKDYNSFEKFNKIFSKYDTSIANKMSYYDLKTFLPSLLHVEDRTSMAHGLESRVPLIDHRIIEFAANIPAHIKFKDGITKYLPKKIFKNIIPNSILDRKDKKGFPTPTNLWFKTTLNEWVKDLLIDKRTLERGLYEKSELIKLVDGSSNFSRALWGVINLELWHREFIDS